LPSRKLPVAMVTENESVPIRIANRVRQLREDSGLSQDAFARLIPCHRNQSARSSAASTICR